MWATPKRVPEDAGTVTVKITANISGMTAQADMQLMFTVEPGTAKTPVGYTANRSS